MKVVTYHYVRPPDIGLRHGLHALAPADFVAQLDWFAAHGGIVDARAFAADPRAEHAGEFLLTFDDGLREHREVATELARRGHSACFFVNSLPAGGGILNPHRLHLLLAAQPAEALLAAVEAVLVPGQIDRAAQARFGAQLYRNQSATGAETRLKTLFNYHLDHAAADALLRELFRRHLGDDGRWHAELYLDSAALGAMARDHVIGNHSVSHRVLARLPAAAQAVEIGDAHAWLESVLGRPVDSFCYPYGIEGSYDAETLGILRRLGYRSAFAFTNRPLDPEASPLEIDRIDCNRCITARA